MRPIATALAALLLTVSASAVEPPVRDQIARRLEGRQTAVLHVTRGLTDHERAELAANGVQIRQALPGGRYLARLSPDAVWSHEVITAIEPLTADMKIHPSALREAHGRTWADLQVLFHRDVTFDEARTAILQAGGALRDPFAVGFGPLRRLQARIAPSMLGALAGDDRVLSVAGAIRFKPRSENAESAAISDVPPLYEAPYGLSGAGVTVSLFELGEAQATHVEFGGRLTLHAVGGSTSDRQHATHVAGTIGASGLRADAKGMAPAVTIHQFCVEAGSNDCTEDWLDAKEEQLSPLGVRVDNNSWGYVLGWSEEGPYNVWNDYEEYYGAYDLLAGAPLDEISNEQGILFVHSAGNDGSPPSFGGYPFFDHRHVDNKGQTDTTKVWCYSLNASGTDCPASCTGGCEVTRHHNTLPYDTIGVTASAKNVIAVGAYSSAASVIAGFSSRGPAKDGRVKPDLVARGMGVLSTIPTNSYAKNQGTSMASPAVAGMAALLVEQWRRTFGGADPTAAQLKALLMAGARDLGNPGPDYTYGFGLVNAKNAVDLILADGAQGRRIRNLTVSQGTTLEIPVTQVEAGDFRIVLNWPDPAIPYPGGDDIAVKALVNDLDVKVIDPSGATHLPWVLDKNSPTAPATTGVNTVDNIEMVEIANAAPGAYRVVVTGRSVTEGPQDAVLVLSADAGETAAPCLDSLEPNESAAAAIGNLASGQTVTAALCNASDVDYFKFLITEPGAVSVTVTTGDTPVRVTLTGSGISRTEDLGPDSTFTLNADANTVPNPVTLRIEPIGAIGADPTYTFTVDFGANGSRRRSVRR